MILITGLICIKVFQCLLIRVSAQNLKNVLLIIVDDLRPEIGVYAGTNDALFPGIQTPNLDTLASESLVFSNAHVQFAICGPSRASFMTSRRPDKTNVVNNEGQWRRDGGNFTSLPQYFKENGYQTFAAGKVYHGTSKEQTDRVYSWSEDNYFSTTKGYWHANNRSWGMAEEYKYNNVSLPDMQIRDYAVKKLREQADNRSQPFLLVIGFEKPHLPLLAPENFYELYPEEIITLAENKHVPENFPQVAWSGWTDLPNYEDMEEFDHSYNNTLPDWKAIDIRRAYYASVSYTDYLIGEVLQELTNTDLEEDTIVVFTSDHGWHLGEHSDWAKSTNYLLDNKVPLMIKVPGSATSGVMTNAMVELVDLLPTLSELAGLQSVSTCPEDNHNVLLCSEGHSMAELINNPHTQWKSATFSQIFRDWKPSMGHCIHTNEFQYVLWVHYENSTSYWDIEYNEELYDLLIDPNQTKNVENEPQYASVKADLKERLYAGWRTALPR